MSAEKTYSRNDKSLVYINKALSTESGGSCEIRTHGGLLTLAGFQDRCIQPLCQASSPGALGRNRTGTDALSERF